MRPVPVVSLPALERGLHLLTCLASADEPLGFIALQAATGIPRASLARLLAVLAAGGWVVREGGRCRLGPAHRRLIAGLGPIEDLRATVEPVLSELCRDSGNSACCFRFIGSETECLAKAVDERALPMQVLGERRRDLAHSPWGWLLLGRQSLIERRRWYRSTDLDGHQRQAIEDQLAALPSQGFLVDQIIQPGFWVRLAAPIVVRDDDGNQRLIGALALGGNPLTLPKAALAMQGCLLLAARDRLLALTGGEQRPGHKA